MKKEPPDSPLKPGDFPFRLTHDATESPLLTWLRNHSNFLATRGLLDYFRIGAILIRGVIVNSLVTLPLLLLIALVIGLVYGTLLRDWDEELAPSDERNELLHDMLAYRGVRGDTFWRDPNPGSGLSNSEWLSLKARYNEAQERMERRRWSAQIHFFLTKLETAPPLIVREDFEDLPSLAAQLDPVVPDGAPKPKLRAIDDYVSRRFNQSPGEPVFGAIAEYRRQDARSPRDEKKTAEAAARLRDELSKEFNLLMHDPFLYDKQRFKDSNVTLRAGTKLLLQKWQGSRDVTIGGFTDLPSLARRLKTGPAEPPNFARDLLRDTGRDIDRWIAAQLSPDTRKLLVEYQGSASDPRPLQEALAPFFEGLIRGPAIYQECNLIDLNLRPKTERLLELFRKRDELVKTGKAGEITADLPAWGDADNTVRLNRLIIEDTYPLELWFQVGGSDLARVNRRLLEDAYPGVLHRQHRGWVMWMQDHVGACPPFVLTPVVLILAVLWVLWFPVQSIFHRIIGHKRSLLTGTPSSVNRRDLFERTFGFALLAVTVVALFELLPLIVHFYHQFRVTHLNGALPWREYLAAAGTIYSLLAGAQKLTSALAGFARRLAVFVIGALGLAAPFMVIVAATDFLVYVELPDTPVNIGILVGSLAVVPFLYTLLTAGAFTVGWTTRAFSAGEAWGALKLWLQAVGLHVLIGLAFVGIATICLSFPEQVPGFLMCPNLITGELRTINLSPYFVGTAAVELLFFCWLMVDANMTSIHGVYRDRIASAYLLRLNSAGQAQIEDDVPLTDLCRHDAGSIAPYHLINVALNLQSSTDLTLRDRRSDFYIFSKKFVGGERTSYCSTVTLERVFPQLDLASAMAISAAAASPNMGRSTVPILVPLLTLMNIRLGVWVPHPGVLAGETMSSHPLWSRAMRQARPRVGYRFPHVFREELVSIEKRWPLLGAKGAPRRRCPGLDRPSAAHALAGVGFSGGGIRSATVNLGIAQALQDAGVFEHFDYMSTVSGGGFLGSSISAFMRYRVSPNSEIAGTVAVREAETAKIVTVTPDSANESPRTYQYHPKTVLDVKPGDRVHAGQSLIRRARQLHRSEIAGRVTIQDLDHGAKLVRVANDSSGQAREYRFESFDRVCVKPGQSVAAGEALVENQSSFVNRFRWRIRPRALRWEMLMRLDETQRWVNVSDGGHIENLAAIELLRRRCKLIVVGDGEADPEMHFNGLATLMRTARIDLGITIDINVDDLRLDGERKSRGRHFALGRITYPGDTECGYLLYLKSSITGDEDEVIWEYRHRSPTFPQESTADQFFDEGQFEAYRAVGQHIAESALKALAHAQPGALPDLASYPDLLKAFDHLWAREEEKPASAFAPV